MRKLLIVFMLFFCLGGLCYAQNIEPLFSSKLVGKDVLYIVDGKIAANVNTLNPDSILEVRILKSKPTFGYSQAASKNSTVIVSTIKGAQFIYKNILSKLSNSYKSFIKKQNGSDDKVLYVLDGIYLEGEDRKTIYSALYDLHTKKIKRVSFKIEDLNSHILAQPIVYITTKN